MAVSNYSGSSTITAPNSEESTELAGLRGDGRKPGAVSETVIVETVDRIVSKYSIDRIIHMKVDTEGNDGRVMYGADQTLTRHKVTTAVLEYDRTAWGSVYGTPLRAVVSWLDKRGYDSYFIADGNLIRLSSGDSTVSSGWWQDQSYGRTAWSNIWVSLRSSACARKTIAAFAAKNDVIPSACYFM